MDRENSDWKRAIQEEIFRVKEMERLLDEQNFDEETKAIMLERVKMEMKQNVISNYLEVL